ncbi:MAG: NEL-type E3 ubiquitin ligase domain-containing protein [Candidatus Rhabdochlamydia sp.]
MQLPEFSEIKCNLNLSGCKTLLALPKKLKVGGYLTLFRCKALTHLPDDLEVKASLKLSKCKSITTLPQGLKVGGSLDLLRCENLTHLPDDLDVNRNIDLAECTSLTTLPNGLRINGSLDLSRCEALTHLPSNLTVGKHLDLSDCTALTSMLYPINLGGNLNLTGCRSLTSLPNWIITLDKCSDGLPHSIDLTNTGLSPSLMRRVQASVQDHENIQFHFSQEAVEEYMFEFKTLLFALAFWEEETELNLDPEDEVIPSSNVEAMCQQLHLLLPAEQDIENILQFLIRLTGTADYFNIATRTHLAKRVVQMIQLMTQDPEICVQFAYLIHQGLSSCDDRVMATLDTLGFYHKLLQLKEPSITSEELKEAGKGFFLLEELNKKINTYIKTLRFVDEVEVYMAFHTRLKSVLNLPLETEGMLFRGCATVSDEEIDTVGHLVLQEMTQASFDSFLMSWEPWQRYQRRSTVLPWEELPLGAKAVSEDDLCPYLQDRPERPVLYNHVVYDYAPFIQRYIEEGTDLNRQPVQIHELLRLNLLPPLKESWETVENPANALSERALKRVKHE